MVAMGQLSFHEAKTHPPRNVALQALGVQPEIDVVITSSQLQSGDQMLLCSDGLWGKVEAEEVKEVVERFPPRRLAKAWCDSPMNPAGKTTLIITSFTGDGLPTAAENEVPPIKRKRWWWFLWWNYRE